MMVAGTTNDLLLLVVMRMNWLAERLSDKATCHGAFGEP